MKRFITQDLIDSEFESDSADGSKNEVNYEVKSFFAKFLNV